MFKNLTKLVNKSTITTITNKQATRLFCTRYTQDHEWARSEGSNKYTLGITDFAQRQLGDIVFVDLPSVGKNASKDNSIAVIESVKAVGDVFAPFELKVVEVNTDLESEPELVNESPEGDGWVLRFESSDSASFKKLMTEAEYKKFVESQQ